MRFSISFHNFNPKNDREINIFLKEHYAYQIYLSFSFYAWRRK